MDTLASSADAAPSLPGAATVGSLQREPERLRLEARALQGALEELYRNHYEVFIENHECLSFLQERGRGLNAALKGLTGEVAGLREDCKGFEEGAQGIVADLKRNRQTLQHHLQLVELLEVPQLMDACVRNGLYEQAVDIVGFANTLERRHLLYSSPASTSRPRVASTTSPSRARPSQPPPQQPAGHALVIAGLVQELRALQRQLRERLLQQLRLPIQLPRCLQIISCLRKLDGLALEAAHLGTGTKPGSREHAALELKLQAEFLEARDAWLQSVLDGRSGSSTSTSADTASSSSSSSSRRGPSVASLAGVGGRDPAQGLMEAIEKHRTHWFEIATQFRAIFLDVEDGSGVGASRSSAGTGSGGSGGSKVLSAWLLWRIEAFLGQLGAGLEEVTDGAALADVLEQCLFFAASMGRIGGDFRELLVPVFTRTIRGMADLHWTAAVAELGAMLERCRIEGQQPSQPAGQAGRAASGICYVLPQAAQQQAQPQQPPEQPTEQGQAAGGKKEGEGGDRDDDPLAPPASILSYPPLAQFTNLVLTSLNQLRQCTPWQLAEELEALFLLRMQAAVKALLAHREAVDARQAAAYKLLCKEAQTVVLPYLLACFGAMAAGSTSLPAVLDRPHTQPPATNTTANSEAAATVAAVAARVREHRAALDRLWGDAGVGSVASGPRHAAE